MCVSLRYLFGESVNGHGFVVFGVVTEDKGKISIPGSLQRVQVLHTHTQTHARIRETTRLISDFTITYPIYELTFESPFKKNGERNTHLAS